VGGVSAVIKPGMRAVAVKGDKVIGISGFIQPNNRVDILVTLKDPATKNEITKMVLSNVLVLATGTEIEQKADGKPRPVDVYTLEVDPEQAERLGLAAAEGHNHSRISDDIGNLLTSNILNDRNGYGD